MNDYSVHPGSARPALPEVSVCIANYNGLHLLADCLDSVLGQRAAASMEILVHDDASTDGGVDALRSRYPQVTWLLGAANAGFCAANNRMAQEARGRWLLLLNNDAALFPDAISTLAIAAGGHGQPAIWTLPQYDWSSGALVDRGAWLDVAYATVPNLDARHDAVSMATGACLFLEKTAWQALGGFPEWLGSIAEDTWLCCVARLRGIGIRVANGSGYRHRQGSSFSGARGPGEPLATTFRRRALSERNRLAVLFVCSPGWTVWPWLAVHASALVAEGLALALLRADRRVWSRIYWPALRDNAARYQALAARRRMVQASRVEGVIAYLRGFVAIPQKARMLLRHGLPQLR